MTKYEKYRIINAMFCIALVVVIMISAYKTWSMYGEYTIASFFVSLLMHGGFGLMIYLGIDNLLKKITREE